MNSWGGAFNDPTIVLPGVGLVFGMVMFLSGLFTFGDSLAAMRWDSAPGVVTRSDIEHRYFSGGRSGEYRWVAKVDVQYTVDGHRYTTQRLTWDHPEPGTRFDYPYRNASNQGFIEEMVSSYPEGRKVDVYFKPDEPGFAIVENHLAWHSIALSGVGLFVFAGSLMVAFFLHMGHSPPTIADARVPSRPAPSSPSPFTPEAQAPPAAASEEASSEASTTSSSRRMPRSWRKKS